MAGVEHGALELLTDGLDVITAGYRFAHHELTSGADPASWFWLALGTWLIGSTVTLMVVLLASIAWVIAIVALRDCARRLLSHSARGAGLRTTQALVDRYVRLDVRSENLQAIVNAPSVPAGFGAADDTFAKRRGGSRIAAIMLFIPSIVMGVAVLPRQLLTTAAGVFSLVATWWATGQPRLDEASAIAGVAQRAGSPHVDAESIALVGLAIAALTFLLSRLRTARAIGHQTWRRSETEKACTDLADREIEISKALRQLDVAAAAAYRRWTSSPTVMSQALDGKLAQHEYDLRQALGLPGTQRRRPSHPARRGFMSTAAATTARAQAAVENLREHLDCVQDRTETRILRSTPRRIGGMASRRRLSRAVESVAHYLQVVPEECDLHLEPVAFRIRLAALSENIDPETLPWEQVPKARRQDVLEEILREWRQEAARARHRFEDSAHEQMIEGLIGTARLRAAAHAIFTYLHPAGPLTRVLERLRPV